jgi:hypothetical protein
MSLKDELHRLVDLLPELEAPRALAFLRECLEDPEYLTVEEEAAVVQAREEFSRGETISLEQFKAEHGL